MLYLNPIVIVTCGVSCWYLTLTSVVFELVSINFPVGVLVSNLTLTSVVFELTNIKKSNKCIEFNFNKCCIWIWDNLLDLMLKTLFNFNKCCIWIQLNY